MRFQIWHFIVLLVVIVLIFGVNKLPQLAKSLGQSAKVLKKEMKELQDDVPPEQIADTPGAATGTVASEAAPKNAATTEQKPEAK